MPLRDVAAVGAGRLPGVGAGRLPGVDPDVSVVRAAFVVQALAVSSRNASSTRLIAGCLSIITVGRRPRLEGSPAVGERDAATGISPTDLRCQTLPVLP